MVAQQKPQRRFGVANLGGERRDIRRAVFDEGDDKAPLGNLGQIAQVQPQILLPPGRALYKQKQREFSPLFPFLLFRHDQVQMERAPAFLRIGHLQNRPARTGGKIGGQNLHPGAGFIRFGKSLTAHFPRGDIPVHQKNSFLFSPHSRKAGVW